MRLLRILGPLAGLLTLGVWILWPSVPEGNASEHASEIVPYICRESKQIIEAPLNPVPAIHPETGRATLFRALYCAKCKKWHAVPPPEAFPGNPLTYPCPKHRVLMKQDGPLNSNNLR